MERRKIATVGREERPSAGGRRRLIAFEHWPRSAAHAALFPAGGDHFRRDPAVTFRNLPTNFSTGLTSLTSRETGRHLTPAVSVMNETKNGDGENRDVCTCVADAKGLRMRRDARGRRGRAAAPATLQNAIT
ncbi:hypothetical protein EVAR_74941_1 [Eumeta japonica]|uniref:Uncharacterized protein n=1 Tax=Eumeta variegata TaxID=151549 RepID=A0A4C1UIM3_EUMVA|nr:hypothetical protein EVAR_74941_1 [Eumeta japonica]